MLAFHLPTTVDKEPQYISTLVMLTITTPPLHNKFLITYQYHLKPLTLKVQTIFLLLVP